jgi:hypothetical protein
MAQVALIEDQQVVQTIAVWPKKSSARNRMVLMGGVGLLISTGHIFMTLARADIALAYI